MDADVGGSFRVHLQSLTDFARQLEEQLAVVQRTTRSAAILNRPPDLPLGAFAEAYALSDDHSDAVARSAALLEQVVRSIDFARGVTDLVARRYDALDAGGAQDIAALSGTSGPSGPGGPSPASPPLGSLAPVVTPRPSGGTVYYSTGAVQAKDA